MRNKKNLVNWRRDNLRRLVADLDKSFVDTFIQQINEDGLGYQEWLREQIKKYMEEKRADNKQAKEPHP